MDNARLALCAALAMLLIAGGCDEDVGRDEATLAPAAPSRASASPSPPARREMTRPERVRVQNRAFGASRGILARAIEDLRRLGFWKELTHELYVVKIESRLGRRGVPDDGHLADAILTAQIDERGMGALCDIMFFPTAMGDDLERWAGYHAQGLLDDPPPTRRQFWASILAHELAHCLDDGKGGEPLSERWEARVLEAARRKLTP